MSGRQNQTEPVDGTGALLRLNRRTVLFGGAALALGAADFASAAALLTGENAIRYVVFDGRWHHSRAFAERLAAGGARPLDVAEGLTRLWQDHLVPHWRDGRGTVAGLTTRAVWDGLAQQAMLQFRRPANVGLHHLDDDDGAQVHLICEEIAGSVSACADDEWPVRMAMLVQLSAPHPPKSSRMVSIGPSGRLRGPRLQLATWMIG